LHKLFQVLASRFVFNEGNQSKKKERFGITKENDNELKNIFIFNKINFGGFMNFET
jgi:hypothetical protein